ncbi:MAG: hypothetical protein ACI87E_004564 [Mariniblastus sp.]|jgi:hypothetical protein
MIRIENLLGTLDSGFQLLQGRWAVGGGHAPVISADAPNRWIKNIIMKNNWLNKCKRRAVSEGVDAAGNSALGIANDGQ